MAVIVSAPHKKQDVYDAIIAGYVDGQPVKVEENDRVYYFGGPLPPPLKADGRFVRFDVPIPARARYLTLAATGADMAPDGNTISSDHTVFSGARLEVDPPAQSAKAGAKADRPSEDEDSAPSSEADEAQDRRDAVLLSELFYDQGLLAIPPADVEKHNYLSQEATARVAELRGVLAAKKKETDAIQIPVVHSLTEGKAGDLHVYLQGDPTKPGPVAPRSFPAIFSAGQRRPFESPGSGRLELAQAVTSRHNPLTARVIVNRVWLWHFGKGLVRTPSNFGELGDRPTHPELLDWLASRFMDSGWSLKWLHRQIMRSAAYQQSSGFDEAGYAADPENRLLWRMNRRRLEVEPWRDAILSVSGVLDDKVGGPSIDLAASNNHRRTLYGFISRHKLNDLLRLFDFPDPNITSGRRSVTTVPLQQLFVLNSEFMVAQAKAVAARVRSDAGDDVSRIERVYLLLYSRPPTQQETDMGMAFMGSVKTQVKAGDMTPWEQYALALLASNEFTFVD